MRGSWSAVIRVNTGGRETPLLCAWSSSSSLHDSIIHNSVCRHTFAFARVRRQNTGHYLSPQAAVEIGALYNCQIRCHSKLELQGSLPRMQSQTMAHERDRGYAFSRVCNGSQSLGPSRSPPPSAAVGSRALRATDPTLKGSTEGPSNAGCFPRVIGSVHYRGVSAVHAVYSTGDGGRSREFPLASLSHCAHHQCSTTPDCNMHAEHSLRADVLVAALVLVSLLVTRSLLRSISWNARMRGRALPPGPRGMPFIGNLFNMPQSKAWYGFRDLAQNTYGAYWSIFHVRFTNDSSGDVTYFQVMGRHVMVLGSPTSISEFLEKRTSNTSDRLVTPLVRLYVFSTGM